MDNKSSVLSVFLKICIYTLGTLMVVSAGCFVVFGVGTVGYGIGFILILAGLTIGLGAFYLITYLLQKTGGNKNGSKG